MGWFDCIFAKKEQASAAPVEASPPPISAFNMQDALPNEQAMQAREAIHHSAHEVARRNGIPEHWLGFEILTLTEAEKVFFQLQVNLRHWDAYLLLHSMAFEQAVLVRLRQRRPALAQALRAVLWRVVPTSGCPYEQLPPSVAWTAEAVEQRQHNLALFKASKSRQQAPSGRRLAQRSDDFEPTLQMPQSSEEADAALQQILQARQMRQ